MNGKKIKRLIIIVYSITFSILTTAANVPADILQKATEAADKGAQIVTGVKNFTETQAKELVSNIEEAVTQVDKTISAIAQEIGKFKTVQNPGDVTNPLFNLIDILVSTTQALNLPVDSLVKILNSLSEYLITPLDTSVGTNLTNAMKDVSTVQKEVTSVSDKLLDVSPQLRFVLKQIEAHVKNMVAHAHNTFNNANLPIYPNVDDLEKKIMRDISALNKKIEDKTAFYEERQEKVKQGEDKYRQLIIAGKETTDEEVKFAKQRWDYDLGILNKTEREIENLIKLRDQKLKELEEAIAAIKPAVLTERSLAKITKQLEETTQQFIATEKALREKTAEQITADPTAQKYQALVNEVVTLEGTRNSLQNKLENLQIEYTKVSGKQPPAIVLNLPTVDEMVPKMRFEQEKGTLALREQQLQEAEKAFEELSNQFEAAKRLYQKNRSVNYKKKDEIQQQLRLLTQQRAQYYRESQEAISQAGSYSTEWRAAKSALDVIKREKYNAEYEIRKQIYPRMTLNEEEQAQVDATFADRIQQAQEAFDAQEQKRKANIETAREEQRVKQEEFAAKEKEMREELAALEQEDQEAPKKLEELQKLKDEVKQKLDQAYAELEKTKQSMADILQQPEMEALAQKSKDVYNQSLTATGDQKEALLQEYNKILKQMQELSEKQKKLTQ